MTEADMKAVYRAVDEMEHSIEEEGLSAHAREVLRERLAAIKSALDDYRLRGASGVIQAYREFVGTLLTDTEIQSEIAKSGAQKGQFWKRTKEVILTLGALVGLMNGIADLEHKTLPIIEKFVLTSSASPTIEGHPK